MTANPDADRQQLSMLDHALAYLARNLPVFPVCSPLMGSHKHWDTDRRQMVSCPPDKRGKTPMVKWKGLQTELPSERDIRSWWAKWSVANIGLATGSLSGRIVLDCDSGAAKKLAMERGGLDQAPAIFTGRVGGLHVHVAHPGAAVRNFARRLPGLDFRGDGGYAILPPSRHASGAYYRWVGDSEHLAPPPAPAWLLELLSGTGEDDEAGEPLDLDAIVAGVPEGQRDDALWRLACKLRADGLERRYAELIVSQAAAACVPPFDAQVARGKVARAWKQYEPNATFTVGDPVHDTHAEAPPAEPRPLDEVLAVFRRWLYFGDDSLVLVVLAAIAANLLPGDPLWLMVVGPSSGGKTEVVNAARRVPSTRVASAMTESALLSGTPHRQRTTTTTGGLLREIGSFGILLMKDFTSVLSMNREPRAALLAALREIYDGTWTRHIGTDGGRTLTWQGKLGLIACCTTIIDAHHAVTAAMGERFLFYRLPESNGAEQARRAIRNIGREQLMRDELADAVAGLFVGIDAPDAQPALSVDDDRRLIALGSLAARSRSAVERDGRSREIELIPDAEAPARIAQALRRLYGGCQVIGMDQEDAWRLVFKVGLDCMPKLRRSVYELLVACQQSLTTTEIATSVGYPTTTARRSLEDLAVHGLVLRTAARLGSADTWTLSQQARAWHTIAAPFPDVSVGGSDTH